MSTQPQSLGEFAVILQSIANTVEEMRSEQREMREDLKLIRVVEVEHAHTSKALGRAFDSIEELKGDIKRIDAEIPERLGERLMAIEKSQPQHQFTSGLVMKAVLGAIALVAAGIWGAAVQRHLAPPPPTPISPAQSVPQSTQSASPR